MKNRAYVACYYEREEGANMNKVDEILAHIKKQEAEKPKNILLWILAIIGCVTAIAGIAYAVYRHLTPDYLEEFDEEFDEDFDDYFEDEEETVE